MTFPYIPTQIHVFFIFFKITHGVQLELLIMCMGNLLRTKLLRKISSFSPQAFDHRQLLSLDLLSFSPAVLEFGEVYLMLVL